VKITQGTHESIATKANAETSRTALIAAPTRDSAPSGLVLTGIFPADEFWDERDDELGGLEAEERIGVLEGKPAVGLVGKIPECDPAAEPALELRVRIMGSVRTQNPTEKAHAKWGNHCQNEQRMGKMRALCRLFEAYVGIHSFSHHTLS
jgi:hypothetical protein